MKRFSPTAEGFRLMFRRPTVGLAEVSWRWSLGFEFTFLATVSSLEFLDTLPVTNGDIFLVKTRQPFLIAQAISHILRGSAPRAVLAALAICAAMAIAWTFVGSFGRAATLNSLLGAIRSRFSPDQPATPPRSRLRTLLGLNFLRIGTLFAAAVGCIGALLLAHLVSPDRDPSPGSAFAIFALVLLLISAAAVMLNWFLSLASMFACTVQADTFTALAEAVSLCRDRFGAVMAVSSWFGLAHLVAFFVASSAVGVPLGLAGLLPPAVVIGGVVLVTLLYFAIADFLYIGRLAAYLAIVEMPPMPEPVPLPPTPEAPPRVDQDELILSDVPMLPASLPS